MEGFADYESEEEDTQPPAPVLPSDDSDSENEGEDSGNEGGGDVAAQRKNVEAANPKESEKAKEAKSASNKPVKKISAASALLLSTSKPDFLNPTSKSEAFDLQCNEKKDDDNEIKANNGEPPAKRQALSAPDDAPASSPASIPSSSRPASSVRCDKNDKNKKDVKDKVKTQRVRGQSAHATWKSEVRFPKSSEVGFLFTTMYFLMWAF